MNTLDLDPEWGAIDLLEEVEASFGITLEDAVVERIATVGELYDAICNLTPAWDDQQGSCASSVTFYRLRRALVHIDRNAVTPRMGLPLHGTSPSSSSVCWNARAGSVFQVLTPPRVASSAGDWFQSGSSAG